jgi:hypothetical protein
MALHATSLDYERRQPETPRWLLDTSSAIARTTQSSGWGIHRLCSLNTTGGLGGSRLLPMCKSHQGWFADERHDCATKLQRLREMTPRSRGSRVSSI